MSSILNLIENYLYKEENCPSGAHQHQGISHCHPIETIHKDPRVRHHQGISTDLDAYEEHGISAPLRDDEKEILETTTSIEELARSFYEYGWTRDSRKIERLAEYFNSDGYLEDEDWKFLIEAGKRAKAITNYMGKTLEGTKYIKGLTKSSLDFDVAAIEREAALWEEELDAWDKRETTEETKKRIAEDIGERLKGNRDILALYEFFKQNDMLVFEQNTPEAMTASILIKAWATSSADHEALSIAIQDAIVEEFGIENYSDVYKRLDDTGEYDLFKPAIKAFVRAQYENTQEFLKSKNVKAVSLFRGMRFYTKDVLENEKFINEVTPELWNVTSDYPLVTDVSVAMQPASSFSTDIATAEGFALSENYDGGFHAVLYTKVPAEKIYSTCQTGIGCKREFEMVALADNYQTRMVLYERKMSLNNIIEMMEGFNASRDR